MAAVAGAVEEADGKVFERCIEMLPLLLLVQWLG